MRKFRRLYLWQNFFFHPLSEMKVVDLFCGGGGFSCGARSAGAELLLSVEWDAKIAEVYAANFASDGHEIRVEELGRDPQIMAREVRSLARSCGSEPLHLHGSPPCQKLSSAGTRYRNVDEGLRLVGWFLDVVELSRPASWSMEQVPHPKLLEYLRMRGVAFHVVTASDHGVPQSRRRVVAGSPCIVEALRRAEGTGPTVVPKDILTDLRPAERYAIQNGSDNQSVHKKGKYVGTRKFRPGEGTRPLTQPCHTILARGKKLRIYDRETKAFARSITARECALLQGFPEDFDLGQFKTRAQLIAGNAVPPPVAASIVRAAIQGAM